MLLASRCATAQLIAPKDEATADTTVSSPKRPVSAQAESPLSIPVHDFTRNGYPLEVVRILAVEYRVVIGVSGTTVGGDNRTINISVQNGTFVNALDAITRADPRLKWHVTKNGTVHFETGAPLSLMNIRVRTFDVDNPPENWDAFEGLDKSPAVRTWFRNAGCRSQEHVSAGGVGPTLWRNFSVHEKNLPVSSILDELAARSHSYYWSIIKEVNKVCGIEMSMDPQP